MIIEDAVPENVEKRSGVEAEGAVPQNDTIHSELKPLRPESAARSRTGSSPMLIWTPPSSEALSYSNSGSSRHGQDDSTTTALTQADATRSDSIGNESYGLRDAQHPSGGDGASVLRRASDESDTLEIISDFAAVNELMNRWTKATR